jgi:NADH:ubiquinone oxidoreductase subunit
MLYTWLHGELVGTDTFGNKYYRRKARGGERRDRRWVVYDGTVEASRVPPEWHAWLHHTTDNVPPEGGSPRRPWQKQHQPNQTGTPNAYRPPGHTLRGGRREKATGDYETWTPN